MTSHLDYCSALYVGVSQASLSSLQWDQIAAVHLIADAHFSHFGLPPLATSAPENQL